MAAIFIIAHAPLASALAACLAHIYGALPARIGALDITPAHEMGQWLEIARAELLHLTDTSGALVLTDLFGATPSNIAAQLAAMPRVCALAGVNLPMLARVVNYRAEPLDSLVDKAFAGGIDGIQQIQSST
ncbi:PTS system, fructose-specific IIA component [Candidatus Glomeribacter gigasporarum BEG34]|uniref:PTS system, fructose-specific IIA component n=1 Tax=Candidatus Glomeribacter gigasporarum BEG34 TaxID=1070319 RepID=G2JAC3_9BURK|nr:PTS fructose transporter subunit IIA [Candidatus Glomeribacter gigasporarum]CCD29724.1 PTS system, fructose-specific IIA component [Candidatus Glomeribacter gigasporarum BEG34]